MNIKRLSDMRKLTVNEKLLAIGCEDATSQYEAGRLCDKDINAMWSYSQKHVNAFCVNGKTRKDLWLEQRTCCNPHLERFWRNVLEDWDMKHSKSVSQNEENFQHLETIEQEACGIGLRRVRHRLKNIVRKYRNLEYNIILTLIDLEYANLKAKLHVGEIRRRIYDRKEWLMEKLSWLLRDSGWRYGIMEATGKNAAYCLYIYLPNGKQVSFHTNNWQFYKYCPAISCQWDGLTASTMTKLVEFIEERNMIDN